MASTLSLDHLALQLPVLTLDIPAAALVRNVTAVVEAVTLPARVNALAVPTPELAMWRGET